MAGRGTGRTQGPTNERQTKAQRKQEARRERLEIQRRMARTRRTRWIAVAVAVLLVAAAATYYVLRPRPEVQDPQELLAAAPQAAKAAGCTDVSDVGPYQPESADRVHIGVQGGPATMPPLSTYPSVPPASGPHNPVPWSRGVNSTPPPIDQVIHSLEHGAAVVWYAPDVSGEELAKIQDFYGDPSHGPKVIVAPYDYPDQGREGTLPGGATMALVAWHHVETCSSVSLAAAFGFTARYGVPPFGTQSYLGDAPEPQTPI
ncbi:MAG TPA: DUF3105 domain-containing protein [Actinomycetota bacterium]|nr:DUF3105 domain-containing protein [Actinomycetota bacterium]